MIERNISEAAKNSMQMQPVLDEMPERIKIKNNNKRVEDFINWSVGVAYDDCKDMSRDDLILFVLRNRAMDQYLRMGRDETIDNDMEIITDALVDNGMAKFVENEDGCLDLAPVDK